jgi:hypothetical protein
MGRSVTGTSSILGASRVICRMVGRFGTARFALATTPQFAAAVVALVAACQAFEALDNEPGQIDGSAPDGPEDAGYPPL